MLTAELGGWITGFGSASGPMDPGVDELINASNARPPPFLRRPSGAPMDQGRERLARERFNCRAPTIHPRIFSTQRHPPLHNKTRKTLVRSHTDLGLHTAGILCPGLDSGHSDSLCCR